VWIGNHAHPFGFYAGAASLAGCWSLLAWLRSRQKGTFFPEIDYERAQRLRWAALLLQTSGVVHRRLGVRKRPWLFPRSNSLFRRRTASHIVAEAAIKSFLRSGQQMIPYFQFVAVCAFALLVTPPFCGGDAGFCFLSVFPVGAFRLERVALLQRDVRCLVAIGFSGPRRLSKSRFRSSADRVSSVVRRHGSRHLRSVGGGMDASCRLGALPCCRFPVFPPGPSSLAPGGKEPRFKALAGT